MSDIVVTDNRLKDEDTLTKRSEIVKGIVVNIHTWKEATHVLLTLDTGFTVAISKRALKRIREETEPLRDD